MTADDPALRARFKPQTRGGYPVLALCRRPPGYGGNYPLVATLANLADARGEFEQSYTEQGRWHRDSDEDLALDLLPADPSPPAPFAGDSHLAARFAPSTRRGDPVLAIRRRTPSASRPHTLEASVRMPDGTVAVRHHTEDGGWRAGGVSETPHDLMPADDGDLRSRFAPETRGGHRVLRVHRRPPAAHEAASYPLEARLAGPRGEFAACVTEQGRYLGPIADEEHPFDLLPAAPEPAAPEPPKPEPAVLGGEAAGDWRKRWRPETRGGLPVVGVWDLGRAFNDGETLVALVDEGGDLPELSAHFADGGFNLSPGNRYDLLPVLPPADPLRELADLPPGTQICARRPDGVALLKVAGGQFFRVGDGHGPVDVAAGVEPGRPLGDQFAIALPR